MKPASRNAKRVLGCLVAGVLMSQVTCLPALATLGEDVATVENDRIKMKAQLRITSVAGYTVHEIQDSAGTTVREYVAASGKVFAVAWNGPLLPDFRQTLGELFRRLQQRRQLPTCGPPAFDHRASRPGRPFEWTHARVFNGNAYVPSLLPPNFSVADIK